MLRKANDLQGFTLVGQDDEIGTLHDFYFDDQDWTVRYIVVNTGVWLFGRKVLIAPEAIMDLDWTSRQIYTELTQEQVEQSPDIDLEKPVSRQQERSLLDYYSWGYYWAVPPAGAGVPATGSTGVTPVAPVVAAPAATRPSSSMEEEVERAKERARDPHLRSTREVDGYSVSAGDGDIGHVADFFIDEADWRIRYLLIDTTRWLPGKKVLIAPEWISAISWPDNALHVNVTREKVESSPEYNPERALDRNAERHLYAHFGYPAYWL